jgi:glycosyltransferase involved in cell wall biosynthesis
LSSSQHGREDSQEQDNEEVLSVIYWGTYDTSKPRTRILAQGILALGAHLEEIHASVWEKIVDKSQVQGWIARTLILARWVFAYPTLIWRLLAAKKPDLILIGYPGILDVLIAAPIARLRNIPLAWDVFISIYDTVCEDRKLLPANGFLGSMLRRLEKFSIRRADLVFMDTQAHARRLETLFDMDEHTCDSVWVGVETDVFGERAQVRQAHDRKMRVLFYGQFIPLHGIETIIGAARKLRDQPIVWQLVGRGQSASKIRVMLDEDPLPNVTWDEWVDYHQLSEHLHLADLCLGIFGTSTKASSVIPNKVFQIVAAGRPLVTLDSPAIRELLHSEPPCVYLVPAGAADALAEAVLAHHRHFMSGQCISSCHQDSRPRIGPAAIGRQFLDMLLRRKLVT